MHARSWCLVVCLALSSCCHGERIAARNPADGGDALGVGRGVPRRTRSGRAHRLLALGASALSWSSARANEVGRMPAGEILQSLDANRDGSLDMEEYLEGARRLIKFRDITDTAIQEHLLDYYKRLFTTADMNRDGVLSVGEVEFAEMLAMTYGSLDELAAIEYFNGERPKVEAQSDFGMESSTILIAGHDVDGDMRLSKPEFFRALSAVLVERGLQDDLDDPDVVAWMDSLFEKADVDGSTFLDHKEALFAGLLTDGELYAGTFDEKAIAAKVMQDFDRNSDGFVDIEEIGTVEASAVGSFDGAHESVKVAGVLRARFGDVDSNSDGKFDQRELKSSMGFVIDEFRRAL